MKVRQNLYIDRGIADALEALAAGPGGNKSRLVNDALAAWLARRGTKEIDHLFKGRLDRMSRDLAAIRRVNAPRYAGEQEAQSGRGCEACVHDDARAGGG